MCACMGEEDLWSDNLGCPRKPLRSPVYGENVPHHMSRSRARIPAGHREPASREDHWFLAVIEGPDIKVACLYTHSPRHFAVYQGNTLLSVGSGHCGDQCSADCCATECDLSIAVWNAKATNHQLTGTACGRSAKSTDHFVMCRAGSCPGGVAGSIPNRTPI